MVSSIIEFRDHIVLFELGVNVATAKAIIAHARTLAPGKPVTHLITSHNHFDHTAGLRQAIAEGLTIVQRRGSQPQFRDIATHPAPDYPDDLARAPKPLKFQAVDEHLRMSDDTQTLDIYWARNNAHMADVLRDMEHRNYLDGLDPAEAWAKLVGPYGLRGDECHGKFAEMLKDSPGAWAPRGWLQSIANWVEMMRDELPHLTPKLTMAQRLEAAEFLKAVVEDAITQLQEG